jgi:hypothetical protein
MKLNVSLISPANIMKEIAHSGCDCSLNQTLIIILLVLECIQFLSWSASIIISIIRVNTKRKMIKVKEQELELQQTQNSERNDQRSIELPTLQPQTQIPVQTESQNQLQCPAKLPPLEPLFQLSNQPSDESVQKCQIFEIL